MNDNLKSRYCLPPMTRLIMIAEELENVHDLPEQSAVLTDIYNELKEFAEPDYCPYDCSNCHDDDCPCVNCIDSRKEQND